MKIKTVCSTWYEAVQVKSFGCKLAERFPSIREAKRAIKAANSRAVEKGLKEAEYIIMLVASAVMYDENLDVISENVSRMRV